MSSRHKKFIEKIKQAGLFTKGLMYILIGGLTALAVFNLGGQTSGKSQVGSFLKDQPFGLVLLAAVALGLLAYSIWRFYQAYADPGNTDSSKKRIGTRLRYVYSGIFYLFVAWGFGKPAFSGASGEDGSGKKQILAGILDKSWGIYVVVAIALIVLGQAIFQFKTGLSRSFMKKLDKNPDAGKEYRLIKRIGLLGYCARGVVFLVIAYFLMQVAIDHNADRYQGTKGVFDYISGLAMGDILLAITALGLVCYGSFNVMVARHSDLTKIS